MKFNALILVLLVVSTAGVAYSTESEFPKIDKNDPRAQGMDPAVINEIAHLFKGAMTSRHGTPGNRKEFMGSMKVLRAVFLKTHGCAKGTFEVLDDKKIPKELQVGLFAQPSTKTSYVRISTDNPDPTIADQKNSTVGLAIKILGVDKKTYGPKILPGEENLETQDFLLQNSSIFFADKALEFLQFSLDDENFKKNHADLYERDMNILDKIMPKKVTNVFESAYYSTTPYKLGSENYAKYKIIPCASTNVKRKSDSPDENYLAKRMTADLAKKDICLEFQVQLRKETETSKMPLDAATVEWSEEVSKPVTVAKIHLPKQKIADNAEACEDMSFTAWHSLAEHTPVGSINQARGFVYSWMAEFRREKMNGLKKSEPNQ